MSVELMNTLSLAAYIAAGVMLLVAVALFFLLNIPKVIGDISGVTAKKAIEAIRQQNESTGDKVYKPSAVNAGRSKLTDKISPSGRLVHRHSGETHISAETEKFATTELMQAAQATVALDGNATTILNQTEAGATTLLDDSDRGSQASASTEVTIDVEMGFSGSSELIE